MTAVEIVTGAAGMLGQALVRRLRQDGHWVRGVDVRPAVDGHRMDDFVCADLRDPKEALTALCAPAGAASARVWHLAAHHGGVAYSADRGGAILTDNVRIDANVAEAARAHGHGRVLYSSSVAVYPPEAGEGPYQEGDAYPARPWDHYGWSKLTGERLVADVPGASVVRLENCYGPAPPGSQSSVLSGLCERAGAAPVGGVLDVWGDPDVERAFLWCEDAVAALVTVMEAGDPGPTNVTSGDYVTIGEVARLVSEASGKRLRLRPVPIPGASEGSPAGRRRARLDGSRIRALGWAPQVGLRDGIERLYQAAARRPVGASP